MSLFVPICYLSVCPSLSVPLCLYLDLMGLHLHPNLYCVLTMSIFKIPNKTPSKISGRRSSESEEMNSSRVESPRLLAAALSWFSLSVFILSACSPPEIEPPKKTKARARAYEVNLPNQIDLEAFIPPLKYDDQTYRVDGLLMQASKYLNQEIVIKGYVTEVAQCSNRVGDKCDQPYLWIAHELGDPDQRLRVVDMKRRALRRYKVGKVYAFKGRFATSSKSGYVNSRGLLVLKKSHKLSSLDSPFKSR